MGDLSVTLLDFVEI